MNISKPFILRPVFTTLTMITMIAFGVMSYKRLPVAALPEVSIPVIQVSTSFPGASPDQIARMISSPLERQFMLMQGVESVYSANTYQSSTIILQFHANIDINIAAQETEQAIQKALAELPKNLPQNPTYTKFNPTDTPILYFMIYSPIVLPSQIYEYGYSFLGQQLGTVEGVGNLHVYGSPYAVRVKANPQALAARNMGLADLANAINNGNPEQPTGKFYGPEKSYCTKTNGQIVKAKDYEELIVKYIDNAPVRLKDIATVEESVQNNKTQFNLFTKENPEGENLAFLSVYRQPGYNTVQICEKVEEMIGKLAPKLPHGVEYQMPFSLSKWIIEAVADVELTLLIAFFLVVVVVYVYLGRIKNSIIPLITLPITIITTFIFMDLFGYSLDIMSLSALTLSIGFLVDDAIVVLENIVRWGKEKHLDPHEAAMKGAKQIILAVVSISFCLTAVFIPMLFMGGSMGELFHEFAAVIIIAVLVSGFISLSLTPMLCSRFLSHYEVDRKTKMEKFSEHLNDKLLSVYKPSLKFALKHKFWILLLSTSSIALSVILVVRMPKEFLPPSDLGIVQSFIQTPEGTSPEKTAELTKKYAQIAIKHPAVDSAPSISGMPTDNQALMILNLVEDSKRKDIWEIMRELQKSYEEVIDARIFQKSYPLVNLDAGSSQGDKANYQYLLQSFSSEDLYTSAEALIQAMRESPKLSNVSSNFQPNGVAVDISLLRDQANSYGDVNAKQIEDALKYAYGETYISKINLPQNMYYVILEVDDQFQKDPSDLNTLYLPNNGTNSHGSKQVFAQSVIESKITPSPETVNHYNSLASVTISFDQAKGVALSEALEEVQSLSSEHVLPDVMPMLHGNSAAFITAMKQFIILIIVALFVIYIIQGILYENFLYPIIPISSVPVAILGGLLSLMACGMDLSIYAIIGLIMLIGIVMKNGILIVDFTIEIMEEENLDEYEAVTKACLLRFRPIIMTTIAAMMGAVPIALGIGGTVSKGRAPLGVAVVGGLIFAQFVTLFLTPVVFIYIQRLNCWFQCRYKLFQVKHKDLMDD